MLAKGSGKESRFKPLTPAAVKRAAAVISIANGMNVEPPTVRIQTHSIDRVRRRAVPININGKVHRMPPKSIESFSPEDAQMAAAIRNAKDTFGQFLSAFFEPTENQNAFLVKVAFDAGDRVEHIWVADLDFAGQRVRGVLANEPRTPSLKFMQSVEFDPAQITDWMYIEDGYLIGGFTTGVIRDRMSQQEKQVHDANAPYKFRDVP
jgi:uncharacterized protein YegJ (DUF2314 family)